MQKSWIAAPALALGLAAPAAGADRLLTCARDEMDARSYRLVTQGQALNVLRPRTDWWDGFELGRHEEALADLNDAATRLAERALELDAGNLMAHSILARQLVILDEPDAAAASWKRVLDAGGSVVWTATLHDVDARSYFVVAFDRGGMRIYRFGALAARLEKGTYDIPKFPGPEDERFWAGLGGCIDATVEPEAAVAWSDVREIKAGNWVLWFKLTRPVLVRSDRDKKKELREVKVNLHGRTGTLEVYDPVGEQEVAIRGRGPAGYQDLIRRTLVRFVDPDRRIVLPPLKPGAGW